MLIKGSFVTEMSGAVGGVVASHNRSGQYLRARAVPVNPSTLPQQAARAAMSLLVTQWTSALTDAQRGGWDAYAAGTPSTNRLGDEIFLSGQNAYIRLNTPRVVAGLPEVDDAPVVFTGASLAPVTFSTINVPGQTASLEFDDGAAWVSEDDAALIVQLGRPVNPTVNFYKSPYTFVAIVAGNSTTPPTSPQQINVPATHTITDGQRMFGRVRLSLADGRLSVPQIASALGESP